MPDSKRWKNKNPGEQELRRRYVDERLSLRQCGKLFDVESGTIRRWLMLIGISTRSISDAKQGHAPAPHTVEASVNARRKRFLPGRPTVGYKLREDGYLDIWVPGRGYVREHRLKMEKKLGRLLTDEEIVHHKNENRLDNRLRNLLLTNHSDHARHHYDDHVDKKTGRFKSQD